MIKFMTQEWRIQIFHFHSTIHIRQSPLFPLLSLHGQCTKSSREKPTFIDNLHSTSGQPTRESIVERQ